jgi:hypothetical protein
MIAACIVAYFGTKIALYISLTDIPQYCKLDGLMNAAYPGEAAFGYMLTLLLMRTFPTAHIPK